MSLEEIKAAIRSGKKVHYQNDGYIVGCIGTDNWYIKCIPTNYVIGLTWEDGVTMNGKEEHFYIAPKPVSHE